MFLIRTNKKSQAWDISKREDGEKLKSSSFRYEKDG